MVQRPIKSAQKWFITNEDITENAVSLNLNATLFNFTVISHTWSNFAPTKECQFPIAITYSSACLGKLPWKTKLRSFGCLESEQGNWIALFHQVTAGWWVTLSLFRNISFEWNRHSSHQLSVFPNCLCPCVDCEDIIFLLPPVWLTHQMTVPAVNPQAIFNKHLLWSLRGWRSFWNWVEHLVFTWGNWGLEMLSSLPLAALGQAACPNPGCSPR